ncbi:2-phospho-L-lactate guanylyltransferase [Cellulomonas sp. KRMCY2]|uniref:2-phospho-L-lactate guanylyltransferase n=1 Tax=Cellulomonas sp. KRMCY2 TaxID=1304865 RepID=UPI00045E7D47|nr:2-phospho-L-lactate guanylyltransferase [Cellulomonas sp. KRMCY2]
MLRLWSVVVPVKDAAVGKTRLGGVLDERARAALVRAMALDTISAATACAVVAQVVVVTADEVVARQAPTIGRTPGRVARRAPGSASVAAVQVVDEPSRAGAPSGLDAAAAAGVAVARSSALAAPVGVLLGDLPALRPDDLMAALDAAWPHARAMVADADGTGTTVLTVGGGVPFASRFGTGSAAAHAALGYVRLDVAVESTLRHDVDVPADLDALRALRPGPRTARVLDRLFAGGDGPVRAAGRRA